MRNAAMLIDFTRKPKRSISQRKFEQAVGQDLAGVPDNPMLVYQ